MNMEDYKNLIVRDKSPQMLEPDIEIQKTSPVAVHQLSSIDNTISEKSSCPKSAGIDFPSSYVADHGPRSLFSPLFSAADLASTNDFYETPTIKHMTVSDFMKDSPLSDKNGIVEDS